MVSILHLVALSVERSIAIFMPLRHRTMVGEKFMKIAIIIVWSSGCLSLVFIPTRRMINTEGSEGSYSYALYATVFTSFICLIIMLSLFVMGIKTILVVREKQNTVPGQNKPCGAITGNNKATKRIALLLMAYIFTCGPYSLAMFVYMYSSKYQYFISNVMPFLMSLVLLNVVMYSTTSAKYRKAYKSLFIHLSELVICCSSKI